MSPTILASLLALTVLIVIGAIFAVGILALRSREKSKLQQRIAPTAQEREEFATGGDRAVLQRLAKRGKAIEDWVDSDNQSARLMLQAGWRSAQARMLWYIFQGGLPVVMIIGLLIFWLFGPAHLKTPFFMVLLVFCGASLSFLMPRWILRSVAESRRERIKSEVPLFIHLLVLLFEAGLSNRQAFASLVREGRGVLPELGREFEVVLRQLDAGADTEAVLKSFSDVMDIGDLSTVLGVLRQIDRYGGEVREPLLETLKILEERRTMDLRERVNILSGRMTVVMVAFFFPALLIFVAGPAFLSIIRALAQVNGQ
ncbi:type II secretion system F family protein [Stenotrophobium rhamnosiphilum]|uniref:Type II secretion system F family protein n=1 Tax=Stenotrophobium rhamnosiphilum TaxID=2029166 RepID=A0A2T5MJJ5_9GAMM|nr:type II secretion system F family protein [Stenotrophobium rhamnosiphilum]PTU32728.1 type II secretion system F family protein [Stenotrophobium rhamnosiphilum]